MSSNDDEKNKQAIERTSEGSANEEARNGPVEDESTQKSDDTLVTPESPTSPSSASAQLKRKRVESDSKPIARRSDAESADQFPLWVAGSYEIPWIFDG
ncbi:unnamed protein product [Anisakis simplex]|uniref:Uncharacterized protein n=1 Tax=Anisakis simplex TaxID=6269 RepID=A0A0M3JFX2_ANISI|nr:unnamed protein product [Anisakis simplex]